MRSSNLSLACGALVLLCIARAEAATFIVDSTSDADLGACTAAPDDCSLRGALTLANGTSVEHNVHFAIPMTDPGCIAATGVCTILASSDMPNINPDLNGIVVIDGYTQPGALANTLSPDQGGSNAQLKIVLSGNAPSISNAISFVRAGTVRGLVINGFRDNSGGGTAVAFSAVSSGGVVEGCFLGTDVTGTIAVPNGYGVIFSGNPFGGGTSANGRIGGLLPAQRNVISGQTNTGIALSGINHAVLGNLIGTNAAGSAALGNRVGVSMSGGVNFIQFVGDASISGRNVISGNSFAGIAIGGAGATLGHRVVGNFIGTDAGGVLPIGNGAWGIDISAAVGAGVQPPLVGGTLAGEGNVIAFNGTQGVATRNTRGQVIGNRIFGNGQLGISSRVGGDGSAAGRLPNDPGDPDLPPNHGQNFPDFIAFAPDGSSIDLDYGVDSAPANSAYPLRVEFFKADGDEGRDLIGFDEYSEAEAQTIKSISLNVPVGMTLSAEDVIVATATDADGNTSEFSFSTATLAVQTPQVLPCVDPDSIFCSGFEIGENGSLLVSVIVIATSGPFAPAGVVDVSDNRGASCSLTLSAGGDPLTGEGACILTGSGAPGPIAITATLSTFRFAFGAEDGGDVRELADFVID